MRHYWKEYALYKGDEFLDIGTADELSQKYDLTVKTLHWLATSTRAKNFPHKYGYVVLPLPKEEE